MYGFNYVFTRKDDDSMRRIHSLPVLARERQSDSLRRARSFSEDHMQQIWDASVGKSDVYDSSFSADSVKQPLLGDHSTQGGSFIPVLLTAIVGQGAILFGFHMGFGSAANLAVREASALSPGLETDNMFDLMWSTVMIGAMIGCLMASHLADMFGRKKMILFSLVPFSVGPLMMVFLVKRFVALCVGRTLCGLGVGLASVYVPLYIAEVSPKHLRGTLGAANQFLIAVGVVLVNVMGLPIPYDYEFWKVLLCLSFVFLGILCLGVIFVAVETPQWLVKKGREDEAEASLRYLRGPNYNVAAELNEIVQNINRSNDHKADGDIESGKKSSAKVPQWIYMLTVGLRPFLIGISLQLIQQWSGINAVIFNMSRLFVTEKDPTSQEQLIGLYGSIGANGTQAVMTFVTVLLMNKRGRRELLGFSLSSMGVISVLLGVAYQMEWPTISIIVLVMFYMASFSLGTGPLPWLVCAEIFPSHSRELSMSIATLANWSSAFGVTYTFSSVQSALGQPGVFWFYSGIAFLGVVFVLIFLPETKDKSLEEIEEYFLLDNEPIETQ